jgi:transcriptional regulator with XRE-family HTH domain
MLVELKVALVRRGLDQAELARLLHATPSRVSRIVRGHVRPRSRERVRIARILQIPAWRLFPAAGRGRLMGKRQKQSAIKESQ